MQAFRLMFELLPLAVFVKAAILTQLLTHAPYLTSLTNQLTTRTIAVSAQDGAGDVLFTSLLDAPMFYLLYISSPGRCGRRAVRQQSRPRFPRPQPQALPTPSILAPCP